MLSIPVSASSSLLVLYITVSMTQSFNSSQSLIAASNIHLMFNMEQFYVLHSDSCDNCKDGYFFPVVHFAFFYAQESILVALAMFVPAHVCECVCMCV